MHADVGKTGLLALILVVMVGRGTAATATVQAGEELIGLPAPEWTVTQWVNSQPLSLEQLRGQVILLRWWTAPGCPFCEASAPYLSQWHERYAPQGLAVIGLYHPKPPGWIPVDVVKQLAQGLGMTFPLAIDPDWATLRRYWLDGRDRVWTSVSFLIDRQGIIRYVHPGGAYSPEEAQELEATIQALLSQRHGAQGVRAEGAPAASPVGEPAYDFHLINQDGQPVRLSDLRGKVVLVSYIFTRCPMPSMCPLVTAKMKQVQTAVNPTLKEQVVLVSISFDPAYDTPQVLTEYGRQYGVDLSNWQFLTGDAAEIQAAAQDANVIYQDMGEGNFTHNMKTVLIGTDGTIRQWFRGSGWKVEEVLAGIRAVIGGR